MAFVKARWRPLMLAVLAVALCVAFVGVRAGTARAETAPRFTAAEIADGVLFNDGPAAQYLTELHRGEPLWDVEMRRIQELVKRYLDADPQLAKWIAEWMQSGDPLLVTKGMGELGVMSRKALDELYGAATIDELLGQVDKDWAEERLIKDAFLNQPHVFDMYLDLDNYRGADVYLETEVAVWAVAVVAVVVAVTAIDATPREFSERTRLAHEILVQHVTTGLRAG